MPTVVDLFCGIGGLTHGLHLAGLRVVAGVDVDASCRYAYETNNQAVFIEGDVAKIPWQDLDKYYDEGATKILVGCAPCQPFSKYTKRYRKEEKAKGRHGDDWQSDQKWRLLYSFAEKIEALKPDIVSMENVPELQKEQVFDDFVNTLKNLGYNVWPEIVYCPDYGVPQKRYRLVLLASKLGTISLIAPEYKPEGYITVRKAIGGLPPLESGQTSPNDPMHFCARLSDTNLKRIRNSRQGGTWREWKEELQLPCHKRKSGANYGGVYGRIDWDKPAPTITTQFYGYGNGRFGHPEQDRALSMREGAILQSFPPDYRFFADDGGKMGRRELGTHIGNAVPVQLGRAVGESIIKHLEEVGRNA